METATVHPRLFVKTSARGDIALNADNRFYTVLFTFFVELNRAIHITVVGKSDCRHAEFFRALHHLLYLGKPVQKGVMGVGMEMDELCHWRQYNMLDLMPPHAFCVLYVACCMLRKYISLLLFATYDIRYTTYKIKKTLPALC